jgi:UPF0716 family protein affecting phage T7 exclusion
MSLLTLIVFMAGMIAARHMGWNLMRRATPIKKRKTAAEK